VPLTKGYVARVSPDDYEQVMATGPWHAKEDRDKDGKIKTVYAQRSIRKEDGTWSTQFLHRFLLGLTDPKIQADHEDFNGLNNTRSNLRVATHQQNLAHRRKLKGASSAGRGVPQIREQKWRGRGKENGKDIHLGYFDSQEAARQAHDAWVLKTYGEFAYTNSAQQENAEVLQ